MEARERVLTALDGCEPGRVPCALSFYHVDIEALVPPKHRRDEPVDVDFVQFPPSPEEERLLRAAEPFPPTHG